MSDEKQFHVTISMPGLESALEGLADAACAAVARDELAFRRQEFEERKAQAEGRKR